jgi:hypothetical protein
MNIKFVISLAIALCSVILMFRFTTNFSSPGDDPFSDKIKTLQSGRLKFIKYYSDRPVRKDLKKLLSKEIKPSKSKESAIEPLPESDDKISFIVFENKLLDAGLNPKVFRSWFEKGQPEAIYYRENGKNIIITGAHKNGTMLGRNKILHISNEDSVDIIKNERNEEFNKGPGSKKKEEHDEEKIVFEQLNENSYRSIQFKQGYRDNNIDLIKKPKNMIFSLQGPDHYFENIDVANVEALQELRERTISLGHGGEITLKVSNGGFLLDKNGPDFVIFENPFRIGEGLIYQEFAHVGVSETNNPEDYKWFPCNPAQGSISGCAGVVPTDEGADMFDLASVGLEKVKFIKIRDTGTNMSDYGENTEGFDLDSVKLIHAFIEVEPEPANDKEQNTEKKKSKKDTK